MYSFMLLLDLALIYWSELHLCQFGVGERVAIGCGVDVEFLYLLGVDWLVEFGVFLKHFCNVVKAIEIRLF